MGAPAALSLDAAVSTAASLSARAFTHERGVAGGATSWWLPPGRSVLLKQAIVQTFRIQRDAHTGSLQHAGDGS